MKIKHQKTKTLKVRENGRSANWILPNFLNGCLGGCFSYCYMSRYNNNVYINDNFDDIINSLLSLELSFPKIPDQTDKTYYTVEIGNSTDIPLMQKYYDWQKVFDFFNENLIFKSTFATKYPTKFRLYDLVPYKNRIRISLMPQIYSDVLEKHTDLILDRINYIEVLQEFIEVQLNFSPIIVYDGWLEHYDKLFKLLYERNINLSSECIFLTYNDIQVQRNSKEVNELLHRPDIQEYKNSQYANDNIRYKWQLKNEYIKQFKDVYSKYFDLSNIRYIF